MSERRMKNEGITNEQNNTFSRVTIRGNVVRKVLTAKALFFVVAVGNADAQKTDFPRFVAFENLGDLDKTFSIGDRVTVEAYVGSSKEHTEGTLIPVSVKREKSKLDAALAGEPYLQDANEVVIRGTIANNPYAPNDGITLVTIKTNAPKNRFAFIPVAAFGFIAAKLKKKARGDEIEMIGYVRTKPRKEAKDISHTQSIVVTSLR